MKEKRKTKHLNSKLHLCIKKKMTNCVNGKLRGELQVVYIVFVH
jgi:hypothetical protein